MSGSSASFDSKIVRSAGVVSLASLSSRPLLVAALVIHLRTAAVTAQLCRPGWSAIWFTVPRTTGSKSPPRGVHAVVASAWFQVAVVSVKVRVSSCASYVAPEPTVVVPNAFSWASSTCALEGIAEMSGYFTSVRVLPYVVELLPTDSHGESASTSWLVSGCAEDRVVSSAPPWKILITRPALGSRQITVGPGRI